MVRVPRTTYLAECLVFAMVSALQMQVLYVSQTGMTEPLGRSQVIPYLKGLSRAGFRIDLVASEPAMARPDELRAISTELADCGIGYHPSRRSPSHAHPA